MSYLTLTGHLGTVIRACRAVASLAPTPVADARSYFATNRPRPRYAKFRLMGLQIALERLKIAGAQGSVEGARKLAKARANLSFVG